MLVPDDQALCQGEGQISTRVLEMLPNFVMGDREKPSAEAFLSVIRGEILQSSQESFLEDVIRLCGERQGFMDKIIEFLLVRVGQVPEDSGIGI